MFGLEQVTVVVVTHHSAHCLAGLNALLQHCPRVIISDNASNDGTPEQAPALWPQAQVLAHPLNLGFGAANNRALERVRTPFEGVLLVAGYFLDLFTGVKSVPTTILKSIFKMPIN